MAKSDWKYMDLIFFYDGKGYTIDNGMNTVCVGGEEAVKKYMEEGEKTEGLLKGVLELLDEIKAINKIGDQNGRIRKSNLERGGTGKSVRNRKEKIKRNKKKIRNSLHKTKSKYKSV